MGRPPAIHTLWTDSAAGLKAARDRTRETKRLQKEQFERDVREADQVRARAVLQSLDAVKLTSRHRPGLYKKARA
jgi:hypothetical protein